MSGMPTDPTKLRKNAAKFFKVPRNGKLGPQYKVALGDELGRIVEERASERSGNISEEIRQLVWVGLAALDAGYVPAPEIARETVIINRVFAGKP